MKIAGALSLATTLVIVLWGVVDLSGFTPMTMSGVYTGTFFGLITLAVEMAVIGRSLRIFEHNGMQATLQTFIMRLIIVGGLGMWFMRVGSGTDAQAFCLSYCATFFVYMCWLTWRTYNQPVHYQGKSTRQVKSTQEVKSTQAKRARLQTVGSAN